MKKKCSRSEFYLTAFLMRSAILLYEIYCSNIILLIKTLLLKMVTKLCEYRPYINLVLKFCQELHHRTKISFYQWNEGNVKKRNILIRRSSSQYDLCQIAFHFVTNTGSCNETVLALLSYFKSTSFSYEFGCTILKLAKYGGPSVIGTFEDHKDL